ncbi:DUF6301 family protein [Nocardia sp. R16R-3T]
MNVDIEGAIRIARLAAEFDWTWRIDDIPRFCESVGWQIVESWDNGAELRTDLQLQRPVAYVHPQKRIIDDISCLVTDIADDELPWVEIRRLVVNAFADLAEGITENLGIPTYGLPGSHATMAWNRENVILKLSASPQVVNLNFVGPEHQKFLDEVAARDGLE